MATVNSLKCWRQIKLSRSFRGSSLGASSLSIMSPTPPPAAKKAGPTREPTTQLPLIRVKRIIKVDKDIQKCGNEAATLITRATVELFPYEWKLTVGIIHHISS